MDNLVNKARDELLSKEILDRLFYFCLRKVGNPTMAEDLTADIVCEALVSLSHGAAPQSFEAWFWRIARNRYAKWVDRAVRRELPLAEEDVGAYAELLAGEENVESACIHQEDLQALRRELAFVRTEYREILVAHYLEAKRVSVIARETGLLLDTVKTRLKTGRKKLKEGMQMAREFGERSYNPERLQFSVSGRDGPNGEPWSLIRRLITKNILAETYRNPSTAEELALELGIALPYMEDELALLTDSTLIQREKNRYETNCILLSARMQDWMDGKTAEILPQLTACLTTAVEKTREAAEHWIPWEDERWGRLLAAADGAAWRAEQVLIDRHGITAEEWERTQRPGGVQWDLVGYEQREIEEPYCSVGCHSSAPDETGQFEPGFVQYKIGLDGMSSWTPKHISYREAALLTRLARGGTLESREERSLAEHLVSYGYVRETVDGGFAAATALWKDRWVQGGPAFQEATRIMAACLESCWSELAKKIPLRLKDRRRQMLFAIRDAQTFRGSVLQQALQEGYLCLDLDRYAEEKRYLGAVVTAQ